MNGPLMDANGEVSLKSVEHLSREELGQWIFDRLHGKDLWVPLDAKEAQIPHYLLNVLYPKLQSRTQVNLEEVIFDFLSSLARDESSPWLGEPGDELLLLADPVFTASSRREDAVDLFIAIADSERFGNAAGVDLRFRALQALTMLQHRATPQFWHRHFELGGDSYAPVVLEGLGLIDCSQIFSWLRNVEWREAIRHALADYLPSLLEDYGAAAVLPQVQRVLPELSERASNELAGLCETEGLEVRVQLASQIKETAEIETRIHAATVPKSRVRDFLVNFRRIAKRVAAETGANIEVDNSGKVTISSPDRHRTERAIEIVEEETGIPEVGKTYLGKVVRIAEFGAFVEILPGIDGLVHISNIAEHRVKDVRDEVKEGDQLLVKVMGIEGNRIKLSRKAILEEQREKMQAQRQIEAIPSANLVVDEPWEETITFEGGGDFSPSSEEEPPPTAGGTVSAGGRRGRRSRVPRRG